MVKSLGIALLVLASTISGCGGGGREVREHASDTLPGFAGETEGAAQHEADNTGINERDRADTLATPMDQGQGQTDLAITRAIRQGVMANDSLGSDAKNAKIITNGGVVVLRGPVESDQERGIILRLAEGAPGVVRVVNLLEVKNAGTSGY